MLRAGATSEIKDGKGRYPVELAPPEVRDDFVALEARYAGKSGRKSKGKKAKIAGREANLPGVLGGLGSDPMTMIALAVAAYLLLSK